MEYVFKSGNRGIAELRAAIDEEWKAAASGRSIAAKLASESGISLEVFKKPRQEVLSIAPRQNLDVTTMGLVFAVVNMGQRVLDRVGRDIWTQVLLPRLKNRFGTQALRERQNGSGKKAAPAKAAAKKVTLRGVSAEKPSKTVRLKKAAKKSG